MKMKYRSSLEDPYWVLGAANPPIGSSTPASGRPSIMDLLVVLFTQLETNIVGYTSLYLKMLV